MSGSDGEDKMGKRKERLEQNRVSARESRKRRKTMIEELQRSVITLSRENKDMNEQNERLRRQLMDIASKYPSVFSTQTILALASNSHATSELNPSSTSLDLLNTSTKESSSSSAQPANSTGTTASHSSTHTSTHANHYAPLHPSVLAMPTMPTVASTNIGSTSMANPPTATVAHPYLPYTQLTHSSPDPTLLANILFGLSGQPIHWAAIPTVLAAATAATLPGVSPAATLPSSTAIPNTNPTTDLMATHGRMTMTNASTNTSSIVHTSPNPTTDTPTQTNSAHSNGTNGNSANNEELNSSS